MEIHINIKKQTGPLDYEWYNKIVKTIHIYPYWGDKDDKIILIHKLAPILRQPQHDNRKHCKDT